MIKEKRKTENSVSIKQGKNRTQKVSLCLIPSKQLVTNHKGYPFCQNLNIKFKTTKSSPEKAIINQDNYNDSSKNNTKKAQNEVKINITEKKTTDREKYLQIYKYLIYKYLIMGLYTKYAKN